MELSHTPAAIGGAFDDPNLIASSGLVPLIALAEAAGLPALVAAHVLVPTDKGANADLKTMSLVAGMCAGADSIQDMSILLTRALGHCAMGKAFDYCYAPSTLGCFLRQFTVGHVRQRAQSRPGSLPRSPRRHRCSPGSTTCRWSTSTRALVEVHGHGKQGASFGYTGARGLNASAATVTAPGGAPVIVATRLSKGSANSAKGAERIVADALVALPVGCQAAHSRSRSSSMSSPSHSSRTCSSAPVTTVPPPQELGIRLTVGGHHEEPAESLHETSQSNDHRGGCV